MFPETQQAAPDLPTWEIRLLCRHTFRCLEIPRLLLAEGTEWRFRRALASAGR